MKRLGASGGEEVPKDPWAWSWGPGWGRSKACSRGPGAESPSVPRPLTALRNEAEAGAAPGPAGGMSASSPPSPVSPRSPPQGCSGAHAPGSGACGCSNHQAGRPHRPTRGPGAWKPADEGLEGWDLQEEL